MGTFYSRAKNIYYRLSSWPVVGKALKLMSPLAQTILKGRQSPKLSRRDIARQLEILAQAVVVLQRGVFTEVRRASVLDATMNSLKDRLELVRCELFEEIRSVSPAPASGKEKPASHVLNQKKFGDAIARNDIRLNVGCGHKPLADYINVDLRNLPGVDVVADIRDLPVLRGTVTEIRAAHLLEHFTELELKKSILPYWHAVLASQSTLRLVVPDAIAMFQALGAGEMPFAMLREVTFGAQDYGEDFHYTMFSESSLGALLQEAGFIHVETVATNRVNGNCREMEILARKE